MRILHTSDWHIGRTLHGADLSDSADAFIEWLLALVDERAVDVVLISGDLFDRAVPPVDAINRVSSALARLAAKTRVVVTSGNHDGPARLGMFSPLLRQELSVVTDPTSIGTAIEVCGAQGDGALIYALPYLEPELVRQFLSDLPVPEGADLPPPLPNSHQQVVAAALRRVRADLAPRRRAGDERPAIAMVHAFVSGGRASDSERNIEVGGVCAVSADVFDTLGSDEAPLAHGLDYVAAGHLHRPQDVSGASMTIRYAGSPIAYSFSEAGAAKSVTVVDTSDTGVSSIHVVEIPPLHEVRVLSGLLEEVLAEADEAARNAYCSVSITDDARPPHMTSRVREVFPLALVVRHESAAESSMPRGGLDVRAREPREVCEEFFSTVAARDLADEERRIITDVWDAMRTGATS